MSRRYLIVFGPSYAKPGLQLVNDDFFGEGRGYTDADRTAVSTLEIWQSTTLDHGCQTVTLVGSDDRIVASAIYCADVLAERLTEDSLEIKLEYIERLEAQRKELAEKLVDLVGLARMRGSEHLHEYRAALYEAEALAAEVQA